MRMLFRRNAGRGICAVSRVGKWNLKLELVAHFHELQALGPTLDDSVHPETRRRPALALHTRLSKMVPSGSVPV